MKLKVCGMKYRDNIMQAVALQPDYLGFIFYENSARHFDLECIPEIPKHIKKVGVFVNARLEQVLEKIKTHKLQAVQLHGQESPEYCKDLRQVESILPSQKNDEKVEVIKVFSIKENFNWDVLKAYEGVCDYYLFDTKGKLPGGNGYTFNWDVLKRYPSTKPYFLSGGIGISEIENIKEFQTMEASKYCYALDVNSKFELEPGLKNMEELKEFKTQIWAIT